nr:MAG TPA: hypothetical protein [Caudoviricetes sp.]
MLSNRQRKSSCHVFNIAGKFLLFCAIIECQRNAGGEIVNRLAAIAF